MSSDSVPKAAKQNVATVIELGQASLDRRSGVERIGETIANFFGSLRFITAHALAVVLWVSWNVGLGRQRFDPYPFPLLGLIVGIEFILLTTFVLMNQKLQSRRQERWAHLTLQICILTEQEVTKTMQVLNAVCRRLGLEQPEKDPEVTDLARATSVPLLVKELDNLPDD